MGFSVRERQEPGANKAYAINCLPKDNPAETTAVFWPDDPIRMIWESSEHRDFVSRMNPMP